MDEKLGYGPDYFDDCDEQDGLEFGDERQQDFYQDHNQDHNEDYTGDDSRAEFLAQFEWRLKARRRRKGRFAPPSITGYHWPAFVPAATLSNLPDEPSTQPYVPAYPPPRRALRHTSRPITTTPTMKSSPRRLPNSTPKKSPRHSHTSRPITTTPTTKSSPRHLPNSTPNRTAIKRRTRTAPATASGKTPEREVHSQRLDLGMRLIIERFTQPGQVVCDRILLGSWDSAMAAVGLGCTFIGAWDDGRFIAHLQPRLEGRDRN